MKKFNYEDVSIVIIVLILALLFVSQMFAGQTDEIIESDPEYSQWMKEKNQ